MRILSRPDAAHAQSPLPREWRTTAAAVEVGGAQGSTRAAQILLQARQQARAILAAAEEQARALAAAAEQRGWEQGYVEGRQQAQREIAGVTQRLAQLAAGAAVDYETSAYQLDHTLVGLALALARTIVQHEVHVRPETTIDVIRAALREIGVERAVTLRVHPEAVPLVEEHLSLLGIPEAVQVAVAGDPLIGIGGCMVESGSGKIDATLGQQLERLEQLLYEQLDATVA